MKLNAKEGLRQAVLWLLALVAFCLCGIAVLWVFELLGVKTGSLVQSGIQAGFLAWLAVLVGCAIRKMKKQS